MVGDTAAGLRTWRGSLDHTKCGLYSAYEFRRRFCKCGTRAIGAASFRVVYPPSRPAPHRRRRDGKVDRACSAGALSVETWVEETTMAEGEELERTLLTVRDWLRYAVSRFTEAGLVYGHGTASALDEAAYLILHTLHLPIDQLEPWLDARLTLAERGAGGPIIAKGGATH